MASNKLWLALPMVGGTTLAVVLYSTSIGTSAPQQEVAPNLKSAVTLPISQVILFNSGVAHFTRSGQVDGETRVDLNFPEADINDLIKSMTLEDEKGRVSAVSYDSREPINRTLQSFAVNLNNNPTYGQILSQVRGESVEVTLVSAATGQPASLTGKVVGVEKQKLPSGPNLTVEVEVLNLWCQEGMRTIKLNEVQRLRFTNATLENEMKRALETLALSHDTQKKAVSLHFSGEGKRQAKVGYVVENPIWKTSYRLVLDKKVMPSHTYKVGESSKIRPMRTGQVLAWF